MCMKLWAAGIVVMAVLAGGSTPARAEKYSLLVGINTYLPAGESGNDLRGCENDVRTMRKLLSLRRFPTDAAHQRTLLSTRATGAAIASGLRWLIRKAKPGDTVVLYYSGHGTYFPDGRSPVRDEPDGFDEAICPTDCAQNGIILDDDIHDALSRVKARNVTVLFDSCFSGTATRVVGDPRANDPLALTGFRNRRLDFDLTKVKRFPADFGGRKPSRRRAILTQARRADNAPSEHIVYLGGCQPWETSSDDSPTITDNGPPYRGGLFTSLLYLTIRERGIETSWRNLMKEVRRRAAVLNPLQEPYAEGPVAYAPFTTTAGTAGKSAMSPYVGKVPAVDMQIVTAVLTDAGVDADGPKADQFRKEVLQSLRDADDGGYVHWQEAKTNLRMAILQRVDGYRVWVPFYDGVTYQDFPTFEEAIRHIASGARFMYRLRQMAALQNPRSPFRVRVSVTHGPSAVVGANGKVSGRFVVDQLCTVTVLRLDPDGKLRVAMPARACVPRQSYPFSFTAGTARGKELVKVIATRRGVNLSGLLAAGDPSSQVARQVGPDARLWAEDQESLYVGDWRH
jgi:hypothetical protein